MSDPRISDTAKALLETLSQADRAPDGDGKVVFRAFGLGSPQDVTSRTITDGIRADVPVLAELMDAELIRRYGNTYSPVDYRFVVTDQGHALGGNRSRIYGNDAKFRSALNRQLARGRDLLDILAGVKKRIGSTPGGAQSLEAMAIETNWGAAVEKWQKATVQPMLEHLQDGAATHLPTLGIQWPPDSGKPRHARRVAWIEPWLNESLSELERLRGLVSEGDPTLAPPPPTPMEPRDLMLDALKQMKESVLDETRPLPLVGAVVELRDGSVVGAHRSELRNGDHAEYTLFERHLHNRSLEGARLFVTLEPCAPGARNQEKTACAQRVVNARVAEVWIGISDPYPTVAGKGREYLKSHGIVVHDFDPDLQEVIRDANATFIEYAEKAARAADLAPPVIEQEG